MPTPLQLSDTEMAALMDLARPLDPAQRPQFLEAVAAELEVKRQAGEIGEGSVHRAARTVQRRFFDPPQLPPARRTHMPALGRRFRVTLPTMRHYHPTPIIGLPKP